MTGAVMVAHFHGHDLDEVGQAAYQDDNSACHATGGNLILAGHVRQVPKDRAFVPAWVCPTWVRYGLPSRGFARSEFNPQSIPKLRAWQSRSYLQCASPSWVGYGLPGCSISGLGLSS
jgi:hypothetical protein